MNLFHLKGSLKSKLSMLVAVAVMLVVSALGFYFDSFLQKSSLENTRTRMLHGYQRLAYNFNNIETTLKEGIEFAQSDEALLASINLINNYQDKDNYDTYLIDEEKKSIANQLLDKAKHSFNNDITLYDVNQELVAFATKTKNAYQLGYISYKDGQPRLYKRYEHQSEYTAYKFDFSPNIPYKHVYYYDTVLFTNQTPVVTYRQVDNMIVIKSHNNISDSITEKGIAHIELSRIIDQAYFKQLSDTLDLDIQFSFSHDPADEVQVIDKDLKPQQITIQQTENNYTSVMQQNSWDGPIYYSVKLNKAHLNFLLTENRKQLLFILVLVTLSILIIMRYIINHRLDRPLSALMEQIYKIRHQDYSESLPVSTGDELEVVSVNINKLAQTIQEREKSLKESEAHFRTLVKTIPDLVWLKDANGIYLGCNPKFERFFGAKEEDILGKSDYDFVDRELADLFRKHDKAAMMAGGPSMNEEEVTYADDKHHEILETVKTPMYATDGSIIGVLGIGRDITDRKQAEENLRRSQKMDAIGQLTGGIAHDFNNLLGVILGNLELLELQIETDEKTHKRIQSIYTAGQRAADLTQQLLGFSRRDSAEISTTDINEVIKSMGELIKRSLTPEIKIEQNLANNLWTTEINDGEFKDSLLNLCLNARDAMQAHGELTISTKNTTINETYCEHHPELKPGNYIEVTVSDTGEGIAKEITERIFEPFFTTKDQGKGTGLGLAMVYGFVTRSNGYITCESEKDIGTSFKIYLPKSESAERIKADKHTADEAIPRGTELILIVDDEPGLLGLANDILQSLGYRTLTANDGHEALDILAAEPTIDVLFSDIVMPNGINGYDLAEMATKNRPQLKVLLTSGYTDMLEPQNKQPQYAINLLNKPYTQSELAKRIRSILDNTRTSSKT